MDYGPNEDPDASHPLVSDEDEHRKCPACGSPLRGRVRSRLSASSGVQHRPTEDECWKEFWTRLAYIWTSLPPRVQKECITEAVTMDRGRR